MIKRARRAFREKIGVESMKALLDLERLMQQTRQYDKLALVREELAGRTRNEQ